MRFISTGIFPTCSATLYSIPLLQANANANANARPVMLCKTQSMDVIR